MSSKVAGAVIGVIVGIIITCIGFFFYKFYILQGNDMPFRDVGFGLIFIGIIIVIISVIIPAVTNGESEPPHRAPPKQHYGVMDERRLNDSEKLELLETRFLLGEISEETYKELKKKYE